MIESADEFYRLRTSDDPEEYWHAAHDNAPDDVWREIIARFPDMRVFVAHNKTVPITILDVLANDADWRVRDMVAMKRKLPEYLQLRLAQDTHEAVRRSLVYNARATRRVLELIAHDEVEEIREHARSRL